MSAAERTLASIRIGDASALDLLRRPDVSWPDLSRDHAPLRSVRPDVGRRVEVRVKYSGYIARQGRHIERFAKLEEKLIPPWVDYSTVTGLRNEAKQKLAKFTPRSLGQALRISGITPADVTVLAVHLERGRTSKA